MPMKVDLYGTYRLLVGEKTVSLDILPGVTLLDLLEKLVIKFPLLQAELFDPSGCLYGSIPIFINGRNPRLLKDGINTSLQPNDVLSIFSPIASGHINVEDVYRTISG